MLDHEVLLPSFAGGDARALWSAYVEQLCAREAFPEQDQLREILRLAAIAPGAPLVDDETRPVIGVLTSHPLQFIGRMSRTIPRVIARLRGEQGCRIILVPPRLDVACDDDTERALVVHAVAQAFDGIVGPGGADVCPSIYGEENRYARHTNGARDRVEADIARTALSSLTTMLGICRSHQLWNAATGGALHQDLEREGVVSATHLHAPLIAAVAATGPTDVLDVPHAHDVAVVEGSDLASLVAPHALEAPARRGAAHALTAIATNSLHHQAVSQAGTQFRVVGITRDAGTGRDVIEATESDNAITVQWHPELTYGATPADVALLPALARRAVIVRRARAAGDVVDLNPIACTSDPRDRVWVRRSFARHLATCGLRTIGGDL